MLSVTPPTMKTAVVWGIRDSSPTQQHPTVRAARRGDGQSIGWMRWHLTHHWLWWMLCHQIWNNLLSGEESKGVIYHQSCPTAPRRRHLSPGGPGGPRGQQGAGVVGGGGHGFDGEWPHLLAVSVLVGGGGAGIGRSHFMAWSFVCQDCGKRCHKVGKNVVLEYSETPHAVDVHKNYFQNLVKLFFMSILTSIDEQC